MYYKNISPLYEENPDEALSNHFTFNSYYSKLRLKFLSLVSQVILTKAENTMPIIPGFYLPECGIHCAFIRWYLINRCARKELQSLLFDLFEAFDYIESIFLHACATYSDLPSNISNMVVCGFLKLFLLLCPRNLLQPAVLVTIIIVRKAWIISLRIECLKLSHNLTLASSRIPIKSVGCNGLTPHLKFSLEGH